MSDQQRTLRLNLGGERAFVEAAAQLLRQTFTVTYESKDNHILGTTRVRRYLRLLPPELPPLPQGEGRPAERSAPMP
jgi:hypothetical protein